MLGASAYPGQVLHSGEALLGFARLLLRCSSGAPKARVCAISSTTAAPGLTNRGGNSTPRLIWWLSVPDSPHKCKQACLGLRHGHRLIWEGRGVVEELGHTWCLSMEPGSRSWSSDSVGAGGGQTRPAASSFPASPTLFLHYQYIHEKTAVFANVPGLINKSRGKK